ncbi:MAG: branched-chain amino acid transport system ATP-binding protein [Solirubrobacteraceae bacterium]|jgi:ABC-type branched-subunit amino acid transport system ATPase component|nr:branched-chain amino acid transport system ATP-binding protein [Solirubrobacteraceae bacterium]
MFEIIGLASGYREARVINGVDLSLAPGETLAILGRNGVGKTTLLKSAFGLCTVFSGEVRLDGRKLPLGRPAHMASLGLTLLPDDRGVFPSLTVEQNLALARRKGYTPPVDVYEIFPLLRARGAQAAGLLSGGEKQQVGIARAILAGTRLIAIDEFSQGLQPSLVHTALGALKEVAATGVSVVIVEQGPDLPLRYCDRIVGMLKGRITFDALAPELRNSPDVLTDLLVVS